jgi:hypothetical protein
VLRGVAEQVKIMNMVAAEEIKEAIARKSS